MGVEDLFHHVLAVLRDPAYREANAEALQMEWPRIPLPGWPDDSTGNDTGGAAKELAASSDRGRELARLLDPDTPVPGVTTGTLRPEMASIGVPATADGRNIPVNVWNYKLGDYQVLKKWLSYREKKVLGRALKPEEVFYFAEVARRIAGILTLTARSKADVG